MRLYFSVDRGFGGVGKHVNIGVDGQRGLTATDRRKRGKFGLVWFEVGRVFPRDVSPPFLFLSPPLSLTEFSRIKSARARSDDSVVPRIDARIYQSFRASSESASRDVYTTNRSILGGGGGVNIGTVSVLVPRKGKNRIVSDDS